MVRDVQVWVNTLRVRCQCCFQGKDAARPGPQCCALGACCHEVASDWTVHQAWRVLRGALTQAMREELVFRNVAALVRVPMPRSKKMPVWTVDEARRFLESARADGDPMYAGYVLLLTLGLRRRGAAWAGLGGRRPRGWRGAHRVAGYSGSITSCSGATRRRRLQMPRCHCQKSRCGHSSGIGSRMPGGGSQPATCGATAA